MIGDTALTITGEVDRIERLHRDPPAEYDRTAWAVDEMDGELVLIESAVVTCERCDGEAFWARGVAACPDCQQRYKLVG